ncbi:2-succinyl-5-enolpyruvyl-6-hydroxy-3-cyclohexene-1-carboxylate synthase [Alteromonadaceae bacterium Bs31]|nr:2-succinyl-5-enolpyruvyl-6-hydroxy-3-cyclohexene-1-carboxylate synthase [Alteromonadaceae bacterium Bs31]
MYTNAHWAGGLIRCCYELGVRAFFIAPGSRSAPLALASFHAKAFFSDIQLHTHFDERGLAFLALSVSRVNKRPVVIITTSGTAVANLYPAIVEAKQCARPLWVFSADRPDKLLDCGANQAIQQKHLFGKNVAKSLNFTLPNIESDLLAQQEQLVQLQGVNGPVQVNCQFDEPIYAGKNEYIEGLKNKPSLAAVHQQGHSFQSEQNEFFSKFEPLDYAQLVVVLGSLSPEEADTIEPWLKQLECPVIADTTSQFRFSSLVNLVSQADILLADSKFITADCVFQIGGRIVSKRINDWLANTPSNYYLVDQQAMALDPSQKAIQYWVVFEALVQKIPSKLFKHPALSEILKRNQLLRGVIEEQLSKQWNEAAVCHFAISQMKGRVALMPGNSLSIRMLDSYATSCGANIRVFANRGASGIDGLIASACGLSLGGFDQVLAVIGDTSFLHDLNSLALTATLPAPVKFLVLNNDGGKIFSFLPALEQEAYEQLFSMPHGYEFSKICEQFSLDYYSADSREGFEEIFGNFITSKTSAVLECCLSSDADELKSLLQLLADK